MIEIRGFFTDWHEVSKEQAREYISDVMKRMTALKKSEQIAFVEDKRLREDLNTYFGGNSILHFLIILHVRTRAF